MSWVVDFLEAICAARSEVRASCARNWRRSTRRWRRALAGRRASTINARLTHAEAQSSSSLPPERSEPVRSETNRRSSSAGFIPNDNANARSPRRSSGVRWRFIGCGEYYLRLWLACNSLRGFRAFISLFQSLDEVGKSNSNALTHDFSLSQRNTLRGIHDLGSEWAGYCQRDDCVLHGSTIAIEEYGVKWK